MASAIDIEAPLIVIVGPTASGKTSLAIELASRHHGEIVCADSRTVYKYMDIGTAKATTADRQRVPHWGIDLVEPGDRFTAADFKAYAGATIRDIRSRGRVPFLVGGTGLFVDSVIYNYDFGDDREPSRRNKLEQLTIEELIKYCSDNHIEMPENTKNKRYIVRAIEQGGINRNRDKNIINNTIVVGITTDIELLKIRIYDRVEQMFFNGVVEEATQLLNNYDFETEAMTGHAYSIIRGHLEGHTSLDEAKIKIATKDRQLAKRQLTWLRRNPDIKWLGLDKAEHYIDGLLLDYEHKYATV